MKPIRTPETRPLAWQLDTAGLLAKKGVDPAVQGVIDQWVVRAPWAHPIWGDYWLCIVHLRPVIRDGKPLETKIYLEGATHELWLYALDPGADVDAQLASGNMRFLTPVNFAAQLILADDDEAKALLSKTVDDVRTGLLNPDTDAISEWRRRFGDNMMKRR